MRLSFVREQSRAGSVPEERSIDFPKQKDFDKKFERLYGLKAIHATWISFHSRSVDPEYVDNLKTRIAQAETRIRNGL